MNKGMTFKMENNKFSNIAKHNAHFVKISVIFKLPFSLSAYLLISLFDLFNPKTIEKNKTT